MLTVWSFCGLRIKRTRCFSTVVLLNLGRIAAYNLVMFFCKASRNSELMQPSLTPQVLFPDPSALYEITLTFLYAPAVWVIKMGLPP